MNKTNFGRRVELVYTDDSWTLLKPGSQGTYQYSMRVGREIQHTIKWDDGSTLMLITPRDRFKFLETGVKTE